MKTSTKVLIGIGIFILIIILWYVSIYNSLIKVEATVDEQWANVQTTYQRRIDLVPNLVSIVQGAADFETNLQTQVTSLRTGLSSAKKRGGE